MIRVPNIRPSIDVPAERPLPRMSPCASVPRSHPRNPVPSSWFHTTSTASSARRSRACCIPLPILGFAAFPANRRLPSANPANRTCFVDALTLPRDAFHTPRRTPLADSRTASPRPLPPRRSPRSHLRTSFASVARGALRSPFDQDVDLEALLRRRVRSACTAVAGDAAPCPSMGFVPLQGPSTRRSPRPAREPRRCHPEGRFTTGPAPFRSQHPRPKPRSLGPPTPRRPIPKDQTPGCQGTRCRLRDPRRKPATGHPHRPERRRERVVGASLDPFSLTASCDAAAKPPKWRTRASYVGASEPEGEEVGPDTVGNPSGSSPRNGVCTSNPPGA